MFLESIKVEQTSPCMAYKEEYKAVNRASTDLTEILPYLNAIVDKPNYQAESKSLQFFKGKNKYTLMNNQVNITRFANDTELRELMDWIKKLINDTYERRNEITPNHKSSKLIPVFRIQALLPKTNCEKCGEKTCMAFAAKISKFEADIGDCPLLLEPEYKELRKKLVKLLS